MENFTQISGGNIGARPFARDKIKMQENPETVSILFQNRHRFVTHPGYGVTCLKAILSGTGMLCWSREDH
ncbi:MAG TPA: hypothetical protein VMH30_04915 [Verrucomicrobiae bacterium]|nr:hypothetical protein [Verrucomicrobiae bacterium]